MLEADELVMAVRTVLEGEAYLSAGQILERLPMREDLMRESGSRDKAVRRVKDALLKSGRGELGFDFAPNGKIRDLLGSSVPEISMVFRLRG